MEVKLMPVIAATVITQEINDNNLILQYLQLQI